MKDSELDRPNAVSEVISSIQSIAELLPGVVNAATAQGESMPWTSRGMLNRAVDMLRRYRRQLEHAFGQLELERSEAREKDAIQRGIALGIEQEKQRVKEARHGRK